MVLGQYPPSGGASAFAEALELMKDFLDAAPTPSGVSSGVVPGHF